MDHINHTIMFFLCTNLCKFHNSNMRQGGALATSTPRSRTQLVYIREPGGPLLPAKTILFSNVVAVLIKWQNKSQIDHMYITLSIAALGGAFALLQLIHARKLQNASARWQDTPLQLEHSALP